MIKFAGDIIILHVCTKNIWCMIPKIWSETDKKICHFGPFFALFYPLPFGMILKVKIFKKNQKMLGNILLYIYVYHKWRSYTGIYPSSFTNVHFWTTIELFECCKMQVGLSRCYKVSNKFMVEPWCGVQGIKLFCSFYILRTNK